MNWRLGVVEVTRIIENGEPKMLICSDEYEHTAAALGHLVDHIRFFGEKSDGSFDAMVEAGAEQEPAISSTIGGDDPVLILYTGSANDADLRYGSFA